MAEEVRCQHWSEHFGHCGAIIPRLDGLVGEACVVCGGGRWEHGLRLASFADAQPHRYLGPLANECEAGHAQPVEVKP